MLSLHFGSSEVKLLNKYGIMTISTNTRLPLIAIQKIFYYDSDVYQNESCFLYNLGIFNNYFAKDGNKA